MQPCSSTPDRAHALRWNRLEIGRLRPTCLSVCLSVGRFPASLRALGVAVVMLRNLKKKKSLTCNQVLLLASGVHSDPTHRRGGGSVDVIDVMVWTFEHLQKESHFSTAGLGLLDTVIRCHDKLRTPIFTLRIQAINVIDRDTPHACGLSLK